MKLIVTAALLSLLLGFLMLSQAAAEDDDYGYQTEQIERSYERTEKDLNSNPFVPKSLRDRSHEMNEDMREIERYERDMGMQPYPHSYGGAGSAR